MTRRIFAAVSLLLAAVILAACGSEKKEEVTVLYADRLQGEAQIAYEAFAEAFEADPFGKNGAFAELHDSSGERTDAEESAVLAGYQAFLYDHPEAFWLDRSFLYRRPEGGEASGRIEAVALAEGLIKAEEEPAASQRFDEEAERLLQEIPERTTPLKKAELLYTLLTQEVSYKEEAAYDPTLKTEHTAYGALVEKSAVCDGIALAYVYLLKKSGIPAAAVPGEAGGMRHVWTVFCADGAFREADPTWGILKGTAFFDLTSEEMDLDHTRDLEGIGAFAPRTGEQTWR